MPEIRIEERSNSSFVYKPTMPSKWTWIQVGSGIVFLSSATAFAVIFCTPQLSGLLLVAPGATGVASLALFGVVAMRKHWASDYVFSEESEPQGSLRRSRSNSTLTSSLSESDEVNEELSLTYEIPESLFTDVEDESDHTAAEEANFRASFTVTLLPIQNANLESPTEREILPDAPAPAPMPSPISPTSEPLIEEKREDLDVSANDSSKTDVTEQEILSDAPAPTPPPLPPPSPIFHSSRLLKDEDSEKVTDKSEKESSVRDSAHLSMMIDELGGVQGYWLRLDEIDAQLSFEEDPGTIQRLFAERERLQKEILASFGEETEATFIKDSQETSKGMISRDDSSDLSPNERSELEICWGKIEELEVRLSLMKDAKEKQRLLEEKELLESEYETLLTEEEGAWTEQEIPQEVISEIKLEDVPEVKLRTKKENKEIEKLNELNALYTDRILVIAERLCEKIEDQEKDVLEQEKAQLSKKIEDNLRQLFALISEGSSKMEEEDLPVFQVRSAKKPEVTGTKLIEKHFPPVFKAIETLLHDFLIAHYQTSNPKKLDESDKKYNAKTINETRVRAQKISMALASIYDLILMHVDNCEKISSFNEEELIFDGDIDANFNKESFLKLLLVIKKTFIEETKNKEEKFSKAFKSYLKAWKVGNPKENPLSIILKYLVSEDNLFGFRPHIGELKSMSPEEFKHLHRKMMQLIFKAACTRFKEDPSLYSSQNPAVAISPLFPALDYRLFYLFAPLYLQMTAEILNPDRDEALHNLLKVDFVEKRMTNAAIRVSENERAQVVQIIKDYSFDQLYDFFLTDRIEPEMVDISPKLREMEMELMIRLDPKKPISIKCYSLETDIVQKLLEENAEVNKALKEKYSKEINEFNGILAKSGKQLVAIQSGSFSLIYWIKSILGDLQGGILAKIFGKGLSIASVVIDGEDVLNATNTYLKARGKKPFLVELPGFSSTENVILKKNVCILLENLLIPIYDVLLASKGSPMQKTIQDFVDREGIIGKFVLETYPKIAQNRDITLESVVEATQVLQREISEAINLNKINFKIA